MDGLFVGLMTLDSIYLAAAPPAANQKLSADAFTLAAGGPASNAAVGFAALGGHPRLLGALGAHVLAAAVRDDLLAQGVEVLDLDRHNPAAPPLSSIVVSRGSGERAVISRNAAGRALAADTLTSVQAAALLDGVEVILADGHQMELGRAVAAQRGDIPLVVDAGSWKPGFDQLIAGAEYVLCSADFRPPGCHTEAEVMAWLRQRGVVHGAISHGAGAVSWYGPAGAGEVAVPSVEVVDTLGAGDFLHGALCRYCRDYGFSEALARAVQFASQSCRAFGTRGWLEMASA